MKDLCLLVLLASVAVGCISGYCKISQHTTVSEVRKGLAGDAAQIHSALQSVDFTDIGKMEAELERVRSQSRHRIAWIQLRDERGTVRARAGMRPRATFPVEFARSQFRKQRPVFAVVKTQTGPVLLEVFPLRIPVGWQDARFLKASNDAERFGVIEIAAHLGDGVAIPVVQPEFAARAVI